jgi:excisionase family DNA binding protein
MYNDGMSIKVNTSRQGSNDELSCLTCSVREASKILGVSESTVRRMIKDEQLRPLRIRGRTRIALSVLNEFLRGNAGKEAA